MGIEDRIKADSDTVRPGTNNPKRRTQNAHALTHRLAVARISALRPHGSEAGRGANHTSSSLFAFAWPLYLPTTTEETMLLVQHSRYENSSAPPPYYVINQISGQNN